MIVVDTSVLVAIFLRESGHIAFTDIIDEANDVCISAVARIELIAVLCGRRFGAEPAKVAEFVGALGLETVPFSLGQMDRAIDAILRFGRGRHPASLNLGDCFSYALAAERGAPLLFKGDDFARTDIRPA